LETPEVHPPHHPHGGLPGWLEWVTSVSALIVSVTSIVIAVHSGDTMEKLVKANSFPYLIGVASDASPEGADRISVDFYNNGVGPADERSLKIKVAGRYVTSIEDLIAAGVGPQDAPAAIGALRSYRNTVRRRFIPAKGDQFVFRISKTDANAALWDKLDRSQSRWLIEYCYCSVFDECWAVKDEVHTPVKACLRDEPHEFIP